MEAHFSTTAPMEIVVLRVKGMMCQTNCGTTVTNALLNTDGVISAAARFDLSAAIIESKCTSAELIGSIEMMGFDAAVVIDPVERAQLEAQLLPFLSRSVVLEIEGMVCQNNCGKTVCNALLSVDGVQHVVVSYLMNAALVVGFAGTEELVEAMEMTGFNATVVEDKNRAAMLAAELEAFDASIASSLTVLLIEGMMCQKNCGSTVQQCLSSVPGATKAVVSFPANAALVEGSASGDDLVNAVECVGFDAIVVTDQVKRASLISELQAFTKEQDKMDREQPLHHVSFNELRNKSEDVTDIRLNVPLTQLGPNGGGVPLCRRAEVGISGMTCTACVSNVERNLVKVEGVYNISVALIAEKASVEYNASIVSGDDIVTAVDKLGYKATLLEEDLPCDLDAQQGIGKLFLSVHNLAAYDWDHELVKPLLLLPGVFSVNVNAEDQTVKITHAHADVGARDLFEFIQRSGFFCQFAEEGGVQVSGNDEMGAYYRRMFLGSLIFTLPIVFISMVCPHIPPVMALLSLPTGLGIDWHSLLLWVLSTPVQFFFAARFYRNAFKAVKNGVANMDVLVVLGTSSAYIYSMLSLFVAIARHKDSGEAGRDAHFFETSAMLITFILMGKYLENSARRQTMDAITALMDMQVDNAMLVFDRPSKGETGTDFPKHMGKLRRVSNDGSNGSRISSFNDVDQEIAVKNNSHIDSCDFVVDEKLPPVTEERMIDLRLVQMGDILKVLPGQRVPVDGVVTYGVSAVDEAMLTGEAALVPKTVGSSVTGSTLNGHGLLYMRATRVGSDTALSQIMRLVEDAQTSKAPIQEYADRISRWFVPIVVALACATWLGWFCVVFGSSISPTYLDGFTSSDKVVFVFKFGVAVLVISCPCALGLATPTAVMVSTGVGAAHGILIKGAEAIEAGSSITAVVFDKTGTITKGKSSVIELLNLSTTRANAELLELLGTAELASEHPVAKAISNYAKDYCDAPLSSGALSEFEALPGLGIDCRVSPPVESTCIQVPRAIKTIRVLVGNRKLMRRNKISLPPKVEKFLEANEKHGTVVIAAMDRWLRDGYTACVQDGGCSTAQELVVLAAIAVCDPINENASYVVSLLHTLNIKVFMLSGDNATTAEACALLCGIPPDRVFANCLPKQKSNRITKLQDAGEIVAMVGDGINDSPALTLSDLGIAVGAGTDIAIKSADVVLVRSNLMDVAIFVDLARKTLTRIKLNLFFSFIYNVLCIPLAAGIFYPALRVRLPPILAGFMMSLSSVTVVVSSLLLRNYKPPQTMDVEFASLSPSNIAMEKMTSFDNDSDSRRPLSIDMENEKHDEKIVTRSWGPHAGYTPVANMLARNSSSDQELISPT